MKNPTIMSCVALAVLTTSLLASDTNTMAQNSSLLHTGPPLHHPQAAPGNLGVAPSAYQGGGAVPDDRPPINLNSVSWTYSPPPPVRVMQINDVVTIRVDEIASVTAEGTAESRKRTLYEAILTDWIRVTDFRLRPDAQENGDPTAAGESNAQYRAESSVESRETLAFNIAATVVDIRPNGSLVLEARKTIRVNDNLWETSLSGICRAQDIGPDNVVLSKDLTELEVGKQDRGHLRDGYKRGWFSRWLDRAQPF